MTGKGEHARRDDIDFVSGAFWGANPHEQLTWVRENAPVYWDGRAWGISRYEDVREVSKRPDLFGNAQGIRPDAPAMPQLIDTDAPVHTHRRRLVSRGFTPRRVKDLEAKTRAWCDDIIDDVCERGECEFVSEVAAALPMAMIGDALGFPLEERATLLKWSDDMLTGLNGLLDAEGEVVLRAAEAYAAFREYIIGAIEERRREPTDDLLSILVEADVDGSALDDEEVIHDALLILVGGDETTRHVISGGLYQLLQHPDQLRAMQQDPALIPTAVEEMLRWVSPIKNMARTVVRDTTFGGQRMEAGDKLVLLYPSANRDAAAFTDPFRFDIRRTPNDHIAFGLGPHFCLGNSLARLELVCLFEHLLRRLPDIALVSQEEPAYRAANFVSGYERLPVTFTPTAPLARREGAA
ncbi:MAG TPA: cytochrome P450 [Mycobacteriales bacterium]|nr:cytochrome P450 [Mycobacteriales bacterium]